jgi:hypothetical protein
MVVEKFVEFKEPGRKKKNLTQSRLRPVSPPAAAGLRLCVRFYPLFAIFLVALERAASRPRVRIASAKRGEKACPQLIRKQLR